MLTSVQNTQSGSPHLQELTQAAISAALCANWQQAVRLNEQILKFNKDNTEALNRLAKAQYSIGEHKKAEKIYKKVLEIDPYNIIAAKNLEKTSKTNGNGSVTYTANIPSTNGMLNLSQIFLDEPGKTKLVNLLNLAPPAILVSLNCGDQVIINAKNHSITVSTQNGTYLGAFPDDLAHRLLGFINGGNLYEACIKSTSTKSLTIFIRETNRAIKFGNQPSFQSRSSLFDEDNQNR